MIVPVNTQFFPLTEKITVGLQTELSRGERETALTTPDPTGKEALYNQRQERLPKEVSITNIHLGSTSVLQS